MSPLLAGPFQGVWDAAVPYVAGNIVLDRDGIWLAVSTNTNSQPALDNPAWTLVGGTPYIDLVLGDATLRSLNTVPLPILGPLGWYKIPTLAFGVGQLELLTGTVPFDAAMSLSCYMSDGVEEEVVKFSFATSIPTHKPNEHYFIFLKPSDFNDNDSALVDSSSPLSMQNATLYIRSDVDRTGGNGSILRLRLYLGVGTLTTLLAPVTIVNQGTKTFTVTDQAAALNGATGTFVVVGSTGNDGTYTIVSAISGASLTVLTVVEAIPNAVADGFVKKP